ncbi:hypothetical protein [Nannocystis pusilla]|uniref:hypothetical protein n=1 Tax=Nannocystis pusilla TaxID=889268 RepID=UPI003DA683F8
MDAAPHAQLGAAREGVDLRDAVGLAIVEQTRDREVALGEVRIERTPAMVEAHGAREEAFVVEPHEGRLQGEALEAAARCRGRSFAPRSRARSAAIPTRGGSIPLRGP